MNQIKERAAGIRGLVGNRPLFRKKKCMVKLEMLLLLFSLFLSISSISCEPASDIEITVANNTDYDLYVFAIRNHMDDGNDSGFVKKGSIFYIVDHHGIGIASPYRDRFADMIESVEIYKEDTIVYSQVPCDLSKWIKLEEDIGKNNTGTVKYQLDLHNDSLDIYH